MSTPTKGWLRQSSKLLRVRVITGILVLTPLVITFLVLRFVFDLFSQIMAPVVSRLLGDQLPPLAESLASIVLLLIVAYLLGLTASHYIGRRAIDLGDRLLANIPLVRPIYTAVKQVVDTFSTRTGRSFERVVLIEFPCDGVWSMGFVSGDLLAKDGTRLLKVFMPTSPNPTSGYLVLVPEARTVATPVTVEEAIKMIVSGGILSPAGLQEMEAAALLDNERPRKPTEG